MHIRPVSVLTRAAFGSSPRGISPYNEAARTKASLEMLNFLENPCTIGSRDRAAIYMKVPHILLGLQQQDGVKILNSQVGQRHFTVTLSEGIQIEVLEHRGNAPAPFKKSYLPLLSHHVPENIGDMAIRIRLTNTLVNRSNEADFVLLADLTPFYNQIFPHLTKLSEPVV